VTGLMDLGLDKGTQSFQDVVSAVRWLFPTSGRSSDIGRGQGLGVWLWFGLNAGGDGRRVVYSDLAGGIGISSIPQSRVGNKEVADGRAGTGSPGVLSCVDWWDVGQGRAESGVGVPANTFAAGSGGFAGGQSM